MRPAAIDSFVLVERERQKEERIQHQKEDERYWKNKHQKDEKQKEAKQTGRQRERDREREKPHSTLLGSHFKALKDVFEVKLQQNASFHKDKIPF